MDKQQELEDVKANALMIKQLLIDEHFDAFREHFFMLHPYDQAQFYEKVGPDIRQTMYQYLSPQEMAIIFETTE
ncbi:MAG: magnesium transporter, partial [Lysinibacillus sp.]